MLVDAGVCPEAESLAGARTRFASATWTYDKTHHFFGFIATVSQYYSERVMQRPHPTNEVKQGFDSRVFFPPKLDQAKPAECWQDIAREMADEPDADRLLQFASEMDKVLLQQERRKNGRDQG